jgi:hypothetical protein
MFKEYWVVQNDETKKGTEDNGIPYIDEVVWIKLSFVYRYVNSLWNMLNREAENCKAHIGQGTYAWDESKSLIRYQIFVRL